MSPVQFRPQPPVCANNIKGYIRFAEIARKGWFWIGLILDSFLKSCEVLWPRAPPLCATVDQRYSPVTDPLHFCRRSCFGGEMSRQAQPKTCQHCKQPFLPDSRNRSRQPFCRRPACRKASKAKSQQLWLKKNSDYFHGPSHVERVRQWRKKHPDYDRRSRVKPGRTTPDQILHDAHKSGPSSALQDGCPPLQDLINRSPLIIGLIAHLFGHTLQDDIEKETRRLILKGMEFSRLKLGTTASQLLSSIYDTAHNPSPQMPISAPSVPQASPQSPQG